MINLSKFKQSLENYHLLQLNAAGEQLRDIQTQLSSTRDFPNMVRISNALLDYKVLIEFVHDTILPELHRLTDNTTLENSIKALIKEHEEKLHYGYGVDDLAAQVRALFSQYERTAADTITDSQRFQTDLIIWMKALAITAQMVSNASTHHEKDARMRGMIELIESAVAEVQNYDWRLEHFNRHSYRPEHLFKNDFPVRHFKDRAETAERELAELKKELAALHTDLDNAMDGLALANERAKVNLTTIVDDNEPNRETSDLFKGDPNV